MPLMVGPTMLHVRVRMENIGIFLDGQQQKLIIRI